MNKPSWDDAPKWAKYLAMDADGFWCWYENEPFPTIDKNNLAWNSIGKYKIAFSPLDIWKDSLKERPND